MRPDEHGYARSRFVPSRELSNRHGITSGLRGYAFSVGLTTDDPIRQQEARDVWN